MQTDKQLLEEKGYFIRNNLYTEQELVEITGIINCASHNNPNFRQSDGLFAIRNVLNELSGLKTVLLNNTFYNLINALLGEDFFITKAIYFDKPPLSNWSVAWHQDTTISVTQKLDLPGYGPWTLKQGMLSVRPSQEIMESITAIRIHLDNCDATNGALKVVPGSHRLGFIADASYPMLTQDAEFCTVPAGGVMFMKPLLLHTSGKSTSSNHRRVIHLEVSNIALPGGLEWREKVDR